MRPRLSRPAGQRTVWLLCVSVGLTWASSGRTANDILADPAEMLTTATRMDFAGQNALSVEWVGRTLCLRSIPKGSASALYHKIDARRAKIERVRWTWRVDSLPMSADLRSLEREDVGATVMFIFGEPSLFNKDVPTLAYAWTGTPVPDGSVVPSRRYNSLAYVKLRGAASVGTLQTEERDITADFRAVFGREPEPLRYVAVFNDNDQTGEKVSALFGPIVMASPDRLRKVQRSGPVW